MKYLVVLGDGMADRRLDELGNKTPLEVAKKDSIDYLSRFGELGLVKTVPDGMAPASDIANLSIMGYDPNKYYTGRSPLEAISMGIKMAEDDIAIRCNLVCLSEENDYVNKTMVDYSSDEISTEEARVLIEYLDENLGTEFLHFHAGISYRHCVIWNKGPMNLLCTPPHDISDKKITDYMPRGAEHEFVSDVMIKSYELLKDHPINVDRRKRNLNPANSIWLWGEGSKPNLTSFYEKYSLKGSAISAVDLIKGIAIGAGMRSIDVPGSTGTVDTNYDGKAQAAINEFKNGADFVYVHLEGPDESGHRGELDNKIKSIELIDEKVVAPLLKYLSSQDEDFKIMVLPDHPTPLSLKTHTREPVPFVIYTSKNGKSYGEGSGKVYNEFTASETDVFVDKGYVMINRLIGNKEE